jgi:hypothetical protein
MIGTWRLDQNGPDLMGSEPARPLAVANTPEADPASERAEPAEGDGRFGRRPAPMEIDRGLLSGPPSFTSKKNDRPGNRLPPREEPTCDQAVMTPSRIFRVTKAHGCSVARVARTSNGYKYL